MAMYLRACSDGSVNQYHDLYLYFHMLSLTHASECRLNRSLLWHNFALLYVWLGGGIMCTNGGGGPP